MQTLNLPKKLAEKFNTVSKGTKSLRFINVDLVMMKDTGKYFAIEEFLDGEFFKWNNNGGLVNEDMYACTLNAFSHWTYQFTNEYLMVSDLQGMTDGESYLLTDPAIICAEGYKRFGPTNLGQKGIKAFFTKHQCNHICKSLKLKRHEYQLKSDREFDPMNTEIRK